MRKTASKLTGAAGVGHALALSAAALVAAAALVFAGTAAAATVPLSIAVTASGYTTGTGASAVYFANVGGTYGVTYTLKDNETTNTSTTGTTFTGVGFTDTLPAGVTLDDEVGETAKGCGTPFNPTNQPGQTSITETGLTITNGTSCTITLEFVASTPEASALDGFGGVTKLSTSPYYSYGGATATYTYTPSSGPAITNTLAATPADFSITPLALTVAADPTFSVTGVANNQVFGYGANVPFSFSATAAANDAIPTGDVYATDDQGNTLTSGAPLETDVPGSREVSVWVETQDGYLGSETLDYTVNSPKLTSVKTTKAGVVSFDVEYLAAGSVQAKVLDGKKVIGSVTKKVKVGANTAVKISLTAAGKKLLAKSLQRKVKKKGIKVKLSVLYTAADFAYIGNQPTITKSGILLK